MFVVANCWPQNKFEREKKALYRKGLAEREEKEGAFLLR